MKKLLPKILEQARALGVKRLAIPMLGTGTGYGSAGKVTKLYHQVLDPVEDLDIQLYLYKNKAGNFCFIQFVYIRAIYFFEALW